MKFGPVPLSQAQGAILAHSLVLDGARVRKGKILSNEDLDILRAAGVETVVVARLESGDVGEDAAAEALARALVPNPVAANLSLNVATTGRVNIYASGPGVLMLDASAIHAANLVDPMITIATLPNLSRTRKRGMVATVKIISYGVAQDAVTRAAKLALGALRMVPVRLKTATLIQTEIGKADPAKGEAAIRGRLNQLGMDLTETVDVAHDAGAIAAAVRAAKTDLVMILTASATSDPRDVAPEAVRLAGGSVTRFGIPVDPGNLLFLGQTGDRPVIGLPGCARSPALNGADWVLERVVCGIEITDADLAAMGVGGLLKDIPLRGSPREG
ncbi:MAG: molybdopterin-binding protein [Paracoccaceae bacterium]|nr:molybdopterin-binding protein [Paracoccaceae bacterium]